MSQLTKIFVLFSKNQKINYIFLILFSLIGIILELVSIGLLIPLIASLSDKKNMIIEFLNKIGLSDDLSSYVEFENILLFLFFTFVLKFLFLTLLSFIKNRFITGFQIDLMNKLFESYLFRDYLFHKSSSSAKFIRDINQEVHHVSVGFMGSLTTIIIELITISFLSSFLLFFQTKNTIFVIFFAFLITFLIYSFLKKKISNFGELREKINLLNIENIIQAFGGIKEIKIFRKEKDIIQNFKSNSKNIRKLNFLISFFNETPRIFFEFIAVTVFLSVLFIFVRSDYSFIEIVSYFTIVLAIFIRLMPSINRLIVAYVNITINKKSLKLILRELNNTNKNINIHLKDKINFTNSISIKNISFRYNNNEKDIFKNFSLDIKKGEFIALIGDTGSGKSTLLDLITGLLNPYKGKICVDDLNIKNFKVNWFNKIGYVPQSIFLNNSSIGKNIAFAVNNEEYSRENVIDAAKKSQILNFINSKRKKLNTIIGERGSKLSGGQKQRLGIARALYFNSEVLILDEITSSLDTNTESLIIDEISQLKRDKTIIMSTHRESLLKNCDRVYDVNKKIFL
jgi:ABC-type multidrug transport system fused ATPase/permease subunit